jgi:putative transposase
VPAPLNAFLYLTRVGSKGFVENIKEKLGIRAKGRKVEASSDLYHLRESQAAYNSNFTPENGVLSAKNTYFWNVNA